MDDIWKAIAEDYETAKQCLWCPKHAGYWQRQEDKGMYHLWKAYYAATQAETKENLLYARVLMMMNDERYNAWEHDRFHKYIAPAKEAYEAATREGGKQPAAKEMEKVNFLYDRLQYVMKKTENTTEQSIDAYKQIEVLMLHSLVTELLRPVVSALLRFLSSVIQYSEQHLPPGGFFFFTQLSISCSATY